MSDSFYKAFEDRHRGSRDLIKSRLQVYVPFIEVLKEIHSPCNAVDLGCGRGEWLEILRQKGIHARGVDLDDAMLADSRERHLDVENQDAMDCLKALPDESTALITGFHIAEHLQFENLQSLVTEALRVLKPSGLLILETPNPENLVVGASTFYLDPTHQRPLPPELLWFLAEHAGYERTKVLRLNEPKAFAAEGTTDLGSVLTGVSPDYAIVAQKEAPTETTQLFDPLFEKEHGATLESMVTRYEANLGNKLDRILSSVESELAEERRVREQVNSELAAERRVREQVNSELAAEREARELVESELAAVYTSKSWRITWPLRKVLAIVKWLLRLPIRMVHALVRLLKVPARWVLVKSMGFVLRRNTLMWWASQSLNRHPRQKQRLMALAHDLGLLANQYSHDAKAQVPSGRTVGTETKQVYETLTPQGRAIYEQLKMAIQKENQERQ